MPGLPEDLDRLLHDLRGPINSAVIHLEVLKRTAGADARETVETIHSELVRLADMLSAAFGVLALERGEMRALDLRALVTAAVTSEHLEGVTLDDDPWPEVVGDPKLLALAVTHLVRNAVEASAGWPPAHVAVAVRPDGHVDLIVRNAAAGADSRAPNIRPRLYASRKTSHRGVGLVTVLRIARLHGGTLRFDRVDGTVEARLTLPKA